MAAWLTVEDVAAEIGVSPRTVRRMILRGDLAAYRMGPRLVRIKREDLDAAITPLPVTAGDDFEGLS